MERLLMPTSQGKGKGPKKKCPYCGLMYNAAYVSQHIRRRHPEGTLAAVPEVVRVTKRRAKNDGSLHLRKSEVEVYETDDGRVCIIEWLR